jgi:Na+/glutamate symporter
MRTKTTLFLLAIAGAVTGHGTSAMTCTFFNLNFLDALYIPIAWAGIGTWARTTLGWARITLKNRAVMSGSHTRHKTTDQQKQTNNNLHNNLHLRNCYYIVKSPNIKLGKIIYCPDIH